MCNSHITTMVLKIFLLHRGLTIFYEVALHKENFCLFKHVSYFTPLFMMTHIYDDKFGYHQTLNKVIWNKLVIIEINKVEIILGRLLNVNFERCLSLSYEYISYIMNFYLSKLKVKICDWYIMKKVSTWFMNSNIFVICFYVFQTF